jgi:hypothetical protein
VFILDPGTGIFFIQDPITNKRGKINFLSVFGVIDFTKTEIKNFEKLQKKI